MATLFQCYELAQDTALKQRVLAALVRKADFVRSESTSGMSATKIAKRQALALTARLNPDNLVTTFARQIANDGALSSTATFLANVAWGVTPGTPNGNASPNSSLITDAQITSNMDTVWDACAGVDNSGN